MPRLRFNLLAAVILALVTSSSTAQTNKLFIPETLSGPIYNLNMAPSLHSFYPDATTATLAFNGSYLGPTLILEKGSDVQMNVTNQIGEPTTVHWHGMHVAPKNDGGPHTVIADAATWSPSFTVLDRATTFWYHPHLHHKTNEHVYRGLAGMIIVRDAAEAALALPRTYGVDDIPVILQDRRFSPQRQFVFNGGGIGESGNTIVVNGTVEPFLEVEAGIVRLRLLNGSNSRVYQLGLDNNASIFQIGSDGGLLPAPVELTRLRLAPGERAEVLLDLSSSNGQNRTLMSYSSELLRGEPGGVNLGPGGPPPGAGNIDGTDFQILEIRVSGSSSITSIPTSLIPLEPILESSATRTRPMILNNVPGPQGALAINSVELDLNVINEVVSLGDTEIWSVSNATGGPHPFHIHDVQFQILDRNGSAPPANEQGLKDVVLVYPGETVRFITTFEDFADPDTPYMYHCHFLGHEDGGMMGQFIVLDPNATALERSLLPEGDFLLSNYPNPFTDWTTISYSLDRDSDVKIMVFDAVGREVKTLFEGRRAAGANETIWKAGSVPSGTYFVQISINGKPRSHAVQISR
ncbi:multicopper oxidase domain-containing protein [bacterium]|nr:multicopper oxidase domain-containing protein [bacterium]